MNRYVPEDGLVRSTTQDLEDTRDLLALNLRRRAAIVLGTGHLKLEDESSFVLDYHKLSAINLFEIECNNITAVNFKGGYIYAPGSPPDLYERKTLVVGEVYSVCITMTEDFTTPGVYAEGTPYPTPDEGDNTMLEIGIDLEVVLSTATTALTRPLVLYNITSDGTEITIVEDFRASLGITVPVVGVHLIPGGPSEAFLSTLYGGDFLQSGYSSGGTIAPFVDTDSSMARETLLQVEWKPSMNAWMYEVKVVPYINGSPNLDYALTKMKIDDGLPVQRVTIPYANAQVVDVIITPFSQSIYRDKGDPAIITGFIVGSDQQLPELPVVEITTEVLNTVPRSVTFHVTSTPSLENFLAEITLHGSSGNIEIYRGNAGYATVPVPAGLWTPKVVGIMPSGIQTSVFSGDAFLVESFSANPGSSETLQTVPISVNTFSPGYFAAGYFYGPAGGAIINKVVFCSLGSYKNKSGSANTADASFRILAWDSTVGEDGDSILEIEDTGSDWPMSNGTTPPLEYNYMFSNNSVGYTVQENVLYRIDVHATFAGTTTILAIGGTLLLSMTPIILGGI